MKMPKFAELSAADMKEINDCFTRYVFYTSLPSGEKECVCSGCGSEFTIGYKRTMEQNDYELLGANHNDRVVCPKCKKAAILKNKGRAKNCTNLYEECRVVVIKRINKNYVQAIADIATKSYYRGTYNPEIRFQEYNRSRYILRPGITKQWRDTYYDCWGEQNIAGKPFRPKQIGLYWSSPPDNSYVVIGLERLNNTFLNYQMLDEYIDEFVKGKNSGMVQINMMNYLCRFAEYPQIEILQKLGFYEPVINLVENNKKTHPYVNWKAKDIASFFKLTKQEFKLFKEAGGDIDILRIAKLLRNKIGDGSFSTALKYYKAVNSYHRFYELSEIAEKNECYGFVLWDTVKYLKKHGASTSPYTIRIQYFDYCDMARKLQYDLSDPVVRYPKNLTVAHDLAVENYNAQKAEIEARKNAEKEKAATAMLNKKDKQYCFSDGKFQVIVPHRVAEIIEEGKRQQHCVGGYAGRHMEGKLTICFLRLSAEPDKSLYTIEMHNKTLQQVQGHHNNTPLTPEAKAFFDIWLKWVKAGSKRDKNGVPVINKTKIA